MIPLLKKLIDVFLNDEVKVRRWLRACLMAFAGSGLAFADQMAGLLGNAGLTNKIKVAAVVAGFISVAINLGEKNVSPPAP
jgi:hypothetical protein